jgi:hypothetical protein
MYFVTSSNRLGTPTAVSPSIAKAVAIGMQKAFRPHTLALVEQPAGSFMYKRGCWKLSLLKAVFVY